MHRTSLIVICFVLPIALVFSLIVEPPIWAAQGTTRYEWGSVLVGGGGYVLDVVCHPLQKDLVYIRTDVGGFYRWDAKHPAWVPITDMFDASKSNYYGGEGLAVDPTDPNTVYIAAGKYEWAGPGAIFKSTNQGHTWTKLPIDVAMGGNEDHRSGGQRLAVSPLRPSIILFGSRKDGLWRSQNAGATWTRVMSFPGTLEAGTGINAIAFSPARPGAARSRPARPGAVFASAYGDGVYVSGDNGVTWSRTPSGPVRVERLVCGPDGVLFATHSKGVARFANGTWTDVTPAGASGDYCGVSVNPRDSSDVVCTPSSPGLRLFRSHDGGNSWIEKKFTVTDVPPWYSGSQKRIQYVAGLTFDPCVPNRVWLSDWYATYSAANVNSDPLVISSTERGHEEVVVFDLLAPQTGPELVSGVADVDGFVHKSVDAFPKGLGSYYGGLGPSFGDTTCIANCVSQPAEMVRASSNRWNNAGMVSVSHDGGRSWTGAPGWDGQTKPLRVAMSASNQDNIVALPLGGGRSLFTKDGGKTWAAATGLPENATSGDVWNWHYPLAADGGLDGVFYCIANGSVYRSNDGGATFAVSASGLPTSSQSLVTVPGQAGDVWLAMGVAGLYRSADQGKTFARVASVKTASLVAIGVHGAVSKRPTLYVYGTLADGSNGIFRSTDYGATWLSISDPRIPIGDEPCCMAASMSTFGLVFVGTNGRGIYYGKPQ